MSTGSFRAVKSKRVLVDDALKPACVLITDGKISDIVPYSEAPNDALDARDDVVMPGLVDSHVHINEPGRTEWEGFVTATQAAAAGGVTTLVDMPLNSIPPTTTPDAFEQKLAATQGALWVDVGFWGGVVPGNTEYLAPLIDAGVLGFKCFLVDSGVEEFPLSDDACVRKALQVLRDSQTPLLAHAELQGPLDKAAKALTQNPNIDYRKYASFLASRPGDAEDEAVAMMAAACRDLRSPVHIVHHCSATSIETIARARSDGLPFTAETCPHYLHFAAEDIPDGATEFKCVPPIRSAQNREALWEALQRGVIDQVVSDHSPCTPALKVPLEGDFDKAWGGIASLQLGLPVMWRNLHARGGDIATLSQWMSYKPALLSGIADRKGRIAKGLDADLVIWDPDRDTTFHAERLLHRHPVTPYAGQSLRGEIHKTLVRGTVVYDGQKVLPRPQGKAIKNRQ